MFELVKEECERSLGKVENKGKKKKKGVLFFINRNWKVGWYEDGDEENDGKYVGEIENGKPNGQGTETSPECVLQFQFFRINKSTFSKIPKPDD